LISGALHVPVTGTAGAPGRHPQSAAIFLYFLGPEGFTYEYSFGVRRIDDDATWVPRTFDPDEIGSIDMWLGPGETCLQPGPAAAGASRSRRLVTTLLLA
jgi:2,3-dihydroxy-p-cumate/2,3-dihydroxybenzoate 3,4-dioxygenase